MRRLAIIISAAILLTGCGGRGVPKRDWTTLHLVLTQSPTTLDPAQVKDVPGGRVVAHIFGTLVAYDNEGRLTGDVAESFEAKPDGRTWEFRIRAGLRFANGRAVTPGDVIESFERTLAPETRSPRTWVLDRIKGARDLLAGKAQHLSGLRSEGDCLTIELDEPFAPFLGLLTMPAAAVVPREVMDFNDEAFGTGPFRLVSFVPNQQVTLERNPCYPGPGPYVDRVVFRIIEPPISRLGEFQRGLIDIMEVPTEMYSRVADDPNLAPFIARTAAFNTYFIGFNCASGPFSDVRLRRAVASALDRKGLAAAVYPGRAAAAEGPVPPGVAGYDPNVRGVSYDMNCAKALLAAAKFDASRPVRFLCGSGKETVKVCQALRGELIKLGLSVELVPRESGTFKQSLKAGDFDLYYYSWYADYPDAENFLAPLFQTAPDRGGSNPTGYSNPALDALILQSQREPDATKRAALYARIQQTAVDDCPRAWLWHLDEVAIRQPWISGYFPSPVYNTEKSNLVRIVRPAR